MKGSRTGSRSAARVSGVGPQMEEAMKRMLFTSRLKINSMLFTSMMFNSMLFSGCAGLPPSVSKLIDCAAAAVAAQVPSLQPAVSQAMQSGDAAELERLGVGAAGDAVACAIRAELAGPGSVGTGPASTGTLSEEGRSLGWRYLTSHRIVFK